MNSLDRPRRRKYIWDEKTQEWVDQRLMPHEVKADGIIFRPRWFNNLGPIPMYVDSREKLKSILKERNLIQAG